ncbi:Retrovirus-related Pol polyprotein from transposon RE1 [Linum perenne]
MTAPSLLMAATTPSSNPTFQAPPITIKLDRDNFSLWRSTVLSTLETFDLESHVLAPNPPSETRIITTTEGASTTEVNPAYTDWKRSDRLVLLWLRSTLSETALSLVVRATTAHLAWQAIDKSYQSQTRARRMQLKIMLQTMSKGALTMAEYLMKKRAIADSLAENLHPISDEDIIGHILSGLDPSYGAFATAFMMKEDSLSVDDLAGLLLQEEARLEYEKTRHSALLPTSTPTAFTASRSTGRFFPPRTTSRVSTSSSSRPSGSRPRPQCQLCRLPGHEAVDCWQRMNQTDYPSRRPPPQGRPSIPQARSSPRQAYMAQASDSTSVIDPSWYFDTGATDHVTPDFGKLSVADEYNGGDKLQVGNDFTGATSSSRGTQ